MLEVSFFLADGNVGHIVAKHLVRLSPSVSDNDNNDVFGKLVWALRQCLVSFVRDAETYSLAQTGVTRNLVDR